MYIKVWQILCITASNEQKLMQQQFKTFTHFFLSDAILISILWRVLYSLFLITNMGHVAEKSVKHIYAHSIQCLFL